MSGGLGAFVVRRRRAVIGTWLALVVAGGAYGSGAFDVLSSEFGAGSSTESGQVAHRLAELSGTGGDIVVIADGVRVDDPATPVALAPGLAALAAVPGVVDVADPWSTGSPDLRAVDGRAALVVVTVRGNLTEEAELALAHEISDVAGKLDADRVLVGGSVLVGEQFETASSNDLLIGEAIALPLAFLVMVLMFRGLRAAALPLMVAVAGVILTLAVLTAATQLGEVSIFALNVANLLGVGLGIDYGLLMVNRFREERGLGHDVHTAVERTVSTAGRTVVFSALTVAVAMCGMFVFGVPVLSSFGAAGLGVVLLCMAAALTLLPAVLAVGGGTIRPLPPTPDVEGRFYALARRVQRRPALVAGACVAVLAVLAVPFLSIQFEIGDARTLPRSSEVRTVAVTLAERFPSRGADPVTVLADADAGSPELNAWTTRVAGLPGVVGTSIRPGTPDGVAVVDVVPAGTSQGQQATSVVEQLRADRPDFRTQVGGVAAELTDVKDRLGARLPLALTVIVVGTLVLLFLMTGSLVVPVKAVLMNVLSLGASLGALVWIFQQGHLAGVLGFDSVGAVDLWMPVLILIFAFGLSMDYEVFLLSRIKEVHDQTGDSDQAVAVGLQRSGRIITSAAVLIIIVFAGFAAGEVLAIKQLGVGLAIAVFVDATLVRTLLVPATMKLLGERNWWAPAPLRRFHQRFGLHEAPAARPAPAVIDLTDALPTQRTTKIKEPT
ncbi:MAG: hypothetical protein JWN88_2367 [Frankiales bacterium]|nr:hypothetical protein [Frankiales bacterium]